MATASGSLTASSLRHFNEIDQVEDENNYVRDSSPSNGSLFIESSDGYNDNHIEVVGRSRPRPSSIINVDNSSDEETDEDERSISYESISNHMLTVH